MNRKAVGTLTHPPSRSPGKLYQPSRLAPEPSPPRKNSIIHNHFGYETCTELARNRSNSVGRIYNTKHSNSRQHIQRAETPNRYPGTLINYDEIESKLSTHLECSIKNNQRPKYNYLSQHCPPSEIQMRSARKKDVYEGHIELQERRINVGLERQKSEKKIAKNAYNYVVKEKPTQSIKKESSSKNKQNINYFTSMPRKEVAYGIAAINHQEHKSQLENKLKKMIHNYENKNKELSMQMHQLEFKSGLVNQDKKNVEKVERKLFELEKPAIEDTEPVIKNEQLRETFNKLVDFNLTGICLSSDSDTKLQQLWRSIHKQILLDEQLRVFKNFINDQNIQAVLTAANANRLKKIDKSFLKIHTEEYDPFLIEKMNEFLNSKSPNLTNKVTVRWIADNFIKQYEQSERHWMKYLSQEKMECTIRSMFMEKEISGLRKQEGINKELNLRDFTRYLSTLYKANLRNRNVFQIHSKLKGMSYMGRFIELLEEKAGKGSELKRFSTNK